MKMLKYAVCYTEKGANTYTIMATFHKLERAIACKASHNGKHDSSSYWIGEREHPRSYLYTKVTNLSTLNKNAIQQLTSGEHVIMVHALNTCERTLYNYNLIPHDSDKYESHPLMVAIAELIISQRGHGDTRHTASN